jgi:hypothetical protein
VRAFGSARSPSATRASTGRRAGGISTRRCSATTEGHAYWIVASDGGIFTFGVPFSGSVPSLGISSAVGVRIRGVPSGRGYLILSREGGVYSFGSARFFGSAPLGRPVRPST